MFYNNYEEVWANLSNMKFSIPNYIETNVKTQNKFNFNKTF